MQSKCKVNCMELCTFYSVPRTTRIPGRETLVYREILTGAINLILLYLNFEKSF